MADVAGSSDAKIIRIGQCTYHHPFTGKCHNSGKALVLKDCFDRLVLRTLCRLHTDGIEAKS